MKNFFHCVNLWFSFLGDDFMCCKSVWKGVAIFCLALMFGTVTSDSLVSKERSENEETENLISQKKKCVFADKNLKYQNLPFDSEKHSFQNTELKPKPLVIPVSQGLKEKSAGISKEEKEIEEIISQNHNSLPEKNREEYYILLHKENCYE